MRRVILGAAMTLDGYIARPDGSVDFLPAPGAEVAQAMSDLFARIDTVVFGRKTLDASRAHGLGDPPKGNWTTYVFSRSLSPGARDGMVFVNDSPGEFVRRLREQPGEDIFHMGGGELARAFLEADLVDVLDLGIVPVLLGEGIPLFPGGFPQTKFTLVESKAHSNGVVSLRYERAE